VPVTDAVAFEVADAGTANVVVPGPLICDHKPAPEDGALPVIATLSAQMLLSVPALDVVGRLLYITCTSSVDDEHPAEVIVQRYIYVPAMEAVAVEDGDVEVLKVVVPEPLTWDQVPPPDAGVLPVIATLNPQTFLSIPALEVVGDELNTAWTSSVEVQPPKVVVQR
jgi:hypothetical protein